MTYKKDLYEDDKHIIDDQLNKWLTQLRSKVGKNGKITVVTDACHSGDGTRGNEENSKYIINDTLINFEKLLQFNQIKTLYVWLYMHLEIVTIYVEM